METFVDILYEMGLDSAAVGALSMILGFILTGLAIGTVVGLVLYIFRSVGLYAIAKRRNIGGAWLAWIPLGYYWVAGSISDQYKRTVKGKNSYNRIILLVLALVGGVVSAITGAAALSFLIQMLTAIVNGDSRELSYAMMMLSGGSGLMDVLNSGLSLALLVFWQISLYDVYESSCPRYSVMFVVLGVLFPITIPFFLFFNRKKDEGMRIPQPIAPPAYDSEFQY